MSAPLLGLRSIIYPASDVTTATKWWTDFLGFEPYFDEPFYVGFNVGGYELGIVATDEGDAGPTTYWAVDDVEAAVAEAQAHGAVIRESPSDVGDGIIVASVTNPLGQLVGLIYNPHFVAG